MAEPEDNMPKPPKVDPQAIQHVEFEVVRRGYDPDQVHSVLAQAAAAIASAGTTEKREIDDNELMLRLGDKTVRVLEAARESAAEVERRSEERAAVALQRAKEQVLRLQSQAEKELDTARSRAATVEAESEGKAHEILQGAQAEADHMKAEAEDTLRTTKGDASRVEAEANERANRLKTESSEIAARAKGKVDALITTTRTQIEQQRAAADDEVNRLRSETETAIDKQLAQTAEEAQRTLDDAAAKATRVDRQADARYEERVAAGRELGRTLVAEAEAKRMEVLQSLAGTRSRAQLNLEQLRVGRERLIKAFAVAQATIDQATTEMDSSLPEAKAIAEQMVARVGDDEERSLEELESEFQLDRLQDLRILADDDPEGTRAGAEAASSDSGTGKADKKRAGRRRKSGGGKGPAGDTGEATGDQSEDAEPAPASPEADTDPAGEAGDREGATRA